MRAKTLLLIIILAGYGYYVRSMTVRVMGQVEMVGRQYSAAVSSLGTEQNDNLQASLAEYVAHK